MGCTGRNALPSSVGPASTGAPTPRECVGAPGTGGFTATGSTESFPIPRMRNTMVRGLKRVRR